MLDLASSSRIQCNGCESSFWRALRAGPKLPAACAAPTDGSNAKGELCAVSLDGRSLIRGRSAAPPDLPLGPGFAGGLRDRRPVLKVKSSDWNDTGVGHFGLLSERLGQPIESE